MLVLSLRSSNSHRNPSSTEIVVRLWKTRKKLEFVNFYRNIYVPRNRPFQFSFSDFQRGLLRSTSPYSPNRTRQLIHIMAVIAEQSYEVSRFRLSLYKNLTRKHFSSTCTTAKVSFRDRQWVVSCTFQIVHILGYSHFDLVSLLLALEATEPVFEPVTLMAVELINIHLISVQQKR